MEWQAQTHLHRKPRTEEDITLKDSIKNDVTTSIFALLVVWAGRPFQPLSEDFPSVVSAAETRRAIFVSPPR